MSTATAQDRLRQIAILVSCVDAAAGRQILLHLPTETARRVRALAGQLGPVPAEERRKILAEFQRSAAHTEERPAANPTTASKPQSLSTGSHSAGSVSTTSHASDSHSTGNEFSSRDAAQSAWRPMADAAAQATLPNSWMQLKPTALVRFVRQERPAVTAVVLSQLDPALAAEVLQQLPAETSRDVLLRLSRLEEIDPEAMRAIDEHLSQRLTEYQHHVNSEMENSRRIDSLLAAAPSHVRQHWAQILVANGEPTAAATYQASAELPQDVLDIGDQAGSPAIRQVRAETIDSMQQDNQPASSAAAPRRVAEQPAIEPNTAEERDTHQADVLPFPTDRDRESSTAIDRSLIQIEFEEILDLPPATLAKVLSTTDSQFVLLALAGATPRFTKRFMKMLDRRDAKVLQNRLQRIGPIRLREVDEAQRRIVENAAHWTQTSTTQVSGGPARRAAA